MKYLALLGVLAACSTTDDRPQTLAYITETILAPNCATAECHASLHAANGYVFDTVEHAQTSLALHYAQLPMVVPGKPSESYLATVISSQDQFGNRMPLDHPLANLDVDFIGVWITNGADGFVPPP